MTTRGYAQVNRTAWNTLAAMGNPSSEPWQLERIDDPKAWLDPHGWLPWSRLRTALVVCGGGGQQGPLLARMGLEVTVADLSEAQLDLDRKAAAHYDVPLECVRADVCDPEMLKGRHFDLVYQPVSSCYLPDVRVAYRSIARLLRPGGVYLSEHWNPTQLQLDQDEPWDGVAYRVRRTAGDGQPLTLSGPGISNGPLCWYYAHRLHDILGGLCDSGFRIERFAERGPRDAAAAPGSGAHLGAYLPTFYSVLARRASERRPRPAGRPTAGERQQALMPGALEGRDLRAQWRQRGFVVLRDVLQPQLVSRLQVESTRNQVNAQSSTWSRYAVSDDGTYVSGPMRFESAGPGPWLTWLHRHPDLQRLVHHFTGDEELASNQNVAYMYYSKGSFIDVHTDVPECLITLLTAVAGDVPPLIAYPRLRGLSPTELLGTIQLEGGRPNGGVAVPVPSGGLLAIDGRTLPHRRPVLRAGRAGIAALCFARKT
jgi:SAM-dependent methyltransferase